MTPPDVLLVWDHVQDAGVTAWVDGGWGVDALLGEQTRDHDDLDLVLDRTALEQVVGWLEDDGFVVERDLRPTALALRHPDGRGVDLHPVRLTEDGGGDQQVSDTEWFHYPPPVTGTVDGRPVKCCSVETQVAIHLGYPPDDDDHADMQRLAERFGLTLPPPYDVPISRT